MPSAPVQGSPDFMAAPHFRTQVVIACQLLHVNHVPAVPERFLAAQQEGSPWTMEQIQDFIGQTFEMAMDRNTIWHMLNRDPLIKSVDGVQMEAPKDG